MNKDAIWATIIGFILGIAIFCIIIFGPKLTGRIPKISLPRFAISFNLPFFGEKSQKQPPGDNTGQSNPTTLTVTSPLPEALADSDTLLVSGTAAQGSTIIIGGPVDEDFIQSAPNGTFAGKITLLEGKNIIVVTAFSGDKQTEQSITIYYTPETF